ncbi:hypothetical protein [Citrobacter amalonaticus]|uniref:hypothetical protein n=1 Tax=Citrobacter amalonaticus TaxID=35703 RepID=UPI00300CACEE
MSDKITVGEWITTLISQPVEMTRVFCIITLGEFGRWLYGGGKFREMAGDVIICLLLFYLIRPHVMQLSAMAGVKVSSGAIAIFLSLVGTHGIGQLLVFTVKKRTGIDISSFIRRRKSN